MTDDSRGPECECMASQSPCDPPCPVHDRTMMQFVISSREHDGREKQRELPEELRHELAAVVPEQSHEQYLQGMRAYNDRHPVKGLREQLEALVQKWEKEIEYADKVMPMSYNAAEWRAEVNAYERCMKQLRELIGK